MIQVKKLMFPRTILIMEDDDVCKHILIARARECSANLDTCRRNDFSSPIFDILDVSMWACMIHTCK